MTPKNEGAMPKKQTGTLIESLLFGLLVSFALTLLASPAASQMAELTEIQNGVFFLSHEGTYFSAETFNNDKYIDADQAQFFSDATIPELNTPADKEYPFHLVDHYILDSDLVIVHSNKLNSIMCSAYPRKTYLSRDDISISDYTDQKTPPAVYFAVVKGKEPFHNEKVKAITWEFNNYEIEKNESILNNPSTKCEVDGYLIDFSARIIRGKIAVWTGNTHSLSCRIPATPSSCFSCLPKSSCDAPPAPTQVKAWHTAPPAPPIINCSSNRQPPPETPKQKNSCLCY